MHTVSLSKVTSKGQATIPKPVRKKLGLRAGDTVAYKYKDGLCYLQKARPLDHAYASAVEETLKDEWLSANDERAYREL